jgi:hypothetical protein
MIKLGTYDPFILALQTPDEKLIYGHFPRSTLFSIRTTMSSIKLSILQVSQSICQPAPRESVKHLFLADLVIDLLFEAIEEKDSVELHDAALAVILAFSHLCSEGSELAARFRAIITEERSAMTD